jgi:ATP-binding cassette subfamily F protein 3
MALQTVASLSGGQKSRVAFARMCMGNPNFLVLDEPTNHLDIETIEALGKAINKYTVSMLNALKFSSLGSDGSKIVRKFTKLEVICVYLELYHGI